MVHGAGNPVADWIQREQYLDNLQTQWDSGQGLSTEEVEELIWRDVRNSLNWNQPIGYEEVKHWNAIYSQKYFGENWENVGSDEWSRAVYALGNAWSDFGREVGSATIPAMNKLINPDQNEQKPINFWSRLKRLFWR